MTAASEAGASVAVGAVSSEYEGDNLLGQIKQGFPETIDFIPDSWLHLLVIVLILNGRKVSMKILARYCPR